MAILVSITALINSAVNAVFDIAVNPLLRSAPGWVSNLIISAVVGVLALAIYKYTSNQKQLGKVWDAIKAHLLGLILFKDSIAVTLKLQGKLFINSAMLLFHSLKPMAFMIIPVSLILAQLGQWYQARPLMPGEECVVTAKVSAESLNDIALVAPDGVEITAGPVAAPDKEEVCWKVQVGGEGVYELVFNAGSKKVSKMLVAGEGFQKLGSVKAGRDLGAVFMNPSEKPLSADSEVKSIGIEYPERVSKTAGTDWWLGYFFVVSLVAALIVKPAMKVN